MKKILRADNLLPGSCVILDDTDAPTTQMVAVVGICDGMIEDGEVVAEPIIACEDLEAEISDAIEKILIRKGLDKIVLSCEEYTLEAPGEPGGTNE